MFPQRVAVPIAIFVCKSRAPTVAVYLKKKPLTLVYRGHVRLL